ncbi:hypothetical protein DITRI_Ditri03aG0110100 [Diplodiscus trichospermus]
MAPTANRPSPNDAEILFRNVNYSIKSHCQEPGDDDDGDELASTERKEWKSYETKVKEELKEMLGKLSFAGLVTEACSKATRFILSRMDDAEMKRGGRVELEKLPNQLGSNLEFWLFYACI